MALAATNDFASDIGARATRYQGHKKSIRSLLLATVLVAGAD
jgi:hypothetical protein